MSIRRFQNMDNAILLSIVNMQLRDKFDSLDDLTRFYDIDKDALCEKLAKNQCHYDELSKQFK